MVLIPMRLKALAVLFVIMLANLIPVHLDVTLSDTGNISVITNLDVCHTNGSILISSLDVSAITEVSCSLCKLSFSGFLKMSSLYLKPLLLTIQEDQPPKV
jgi:ABC-type spermidine/putrescine transport system permease subunit I